MGAAAIKTTLSCWLRLLWNISPPLVMDSDRPYITAGAIHLPPQTHWRDHAAAAAHAAAHLLYSPSIFDGEGVVPIARALMGLLEDARVEALAMRELPGLARLWRPLHTATAESGQTFEALMQRLARALADPGYDDPDPWVRKGRSLFYGDRKDGCSALITAADVRHAAMRLGHDIGQMRLQFNAKAYRVDPAYRDDHRWMWAAEQLSAAQPPAAAAGGAPGEACSPVPDEMPTRYPEWDRLIARLRPDWCSVIDMAVSRSDSRVADMDQQNLIGQTAARLRGPLQRALTRQATRQRSDDGEVFDPGALVDWQVARRRRQSAESQIYRATASGRAGVAAWLLIDQSASSAGVHEAGGRSLLHTAALSAAAMAQALESAGVACGISGFSSNGRHAVRLVTVKALHERSDDGLTARLLALRPGGSTRLGAALRHASRRLAGCTAGARWLILLSDGEPHDVDVHDPRYLVEDARHAVRAASRSGGRVICLNITTGGGGEARRIFGRGSMRAIRNPADLPQALLRLLEC